MSRKPRSSLPRTKGVTLGKFAEYVDSRPARLGCWRDGATGRYPMLAWLNVSPTVEQRELASTLGAPTAAMMLTSQHHNQVGIAAGWVTAYMTGTGGSQGSSEQDRIAMFRSAVGYWVLRNALAEVRAGVRSFEATGRRIRLPYKGNHSVDALDRLLDLTESLDSIDKAPTFSQSGLGIWMSREGISRPWMVSPSCVRDAFREQAAKVLATYPSYLPDDASIAGVAIRDFNIFWEELLAWGMYMHAGAMLGSVHLPTIVPLVSREDLIGALVAATNLSGKVVERIVQLLTLDLGRCSDGALTPLVPVGDQIVPMSSLIVPTSPQRNLLAVVQTDPSTVGEAGRLLGLAGERATRTLLRRLDPGILVADGRVRVRRPDGSPAGDLDVIACDPATRTAIVFEIKWGITADGNAEVYRVEKHAIDKRARVIALREEIENGRAKPRWPVGWPDMSNFKFRWYVLTRDVLATQHIDDSDVTIRSYQLLSRTLRAGATIRDLISTLDSPPMPPAELCQTQWERIRYGDLQVEIESLGA